MSRFLAMGIALSALGTGALVLLVESGAVRKRTGWQVAGLATGANDVASRHLQLAAAALPECSGRDCDMAVMVVAYADDHFVSRCFVQPRGGRDTSAAGPELSVGELELTGPVRRLGFLFRVGDFVDDFNQRVSPDACQGARSGRQMLEWVGSVAALSGGRDAGGPGSSLDVICDLSRGSCGLRPVPRSLALSAR